MGEEPSYTTARKPGPLNQLILSGYYLGICLPQRKIDANAIAIRRVKLPKLSVYGL
jgi:hypothetical protein